MRRAVCGGLPVGLWLLVSVGGCVPADPPKAKPDPTFSPESLGAAWDDPQRCAAMVKAGGRLVRDAKQVRVGTWNVKWFPDGKPGNEPNSKGGTDLAWLACAITYLDVDVLALQEIKQTERAQQAVAELTGTLQSLTGAAWQFRADGCADPYRQHVALLWRTDRVDVSTLVSHPEIDPTESNAKHRDPSCPGNLRPALGAYVRSLGGGLDFHFATSHLDSGELQKDFANREAAWRRIPLVYDRRRALVADDDFVFFADFNCMGCDECGLKTPGDERALLSRVVDELAPPMVLGESSQGCSHYYRGTGALLDQVVYSKAMQEAYGARQVVSGVCERSQCRRLNNETTPALARLSDHCPVILDLQDRDEDGPVPSAAR